MEQHCKAGTIGGTLLTIASNLGTDALKTAILAAIGAAVSFTVSFYLQRLTKRKRK